jgi:hypothetical protein
MKNFLLIFSLIPLLTFSQDREYTVSILDGKSSPVEVKVVSYEKDAPYTLDDIVTNSGFSLTELIQDMSKVSGEVNAKYPATWRPLAFYFRWDNSKKTYSGLVRGFAKGGTGIEQELNDIVTISRFGNISYQY